MILGILIFQFAPLLVSIYASLTEWDGITPARFVGLNNFKTLFTGDPLFFTTLRNTAYFTIGTVPVSIAVGFGLALLCNQPIRGVALFRTAYFAPFVTNIVAIGFVWFYFFQPTEGVLNGILGVAGVHGPAWLSSSTWVMPALISVSVWQGVGYPMVILLAGLQGIPMEIERGGDSAMVRPDRRMWSIDLPLLTPQLFFLSDYPVHFIFPGLRPDLCHDQGRTGA